MITTFKESKFFFTRKTADYEDAKKGKYLHTTAAIYYKCYELTTRVYDCCIAPIYKATFIIMYYRCAVHSLVVCIN